MLQWLKDLFSSSTPERRIEPILGNLEKVAEELEALRVQDEELIKAKIEEAAKLAEESETLQKECDRADRVKSKINDLIG